MNQLKRIKGYEIIQVNNLAEVNGTGYLLRHKKTNAKVSVVINDDKNKVFTIGFRTPPTNSKGIQHIIEHTVLCGSKKYPVKDPFIELAKGSLNTFLNAMTYSDKTVYPVASCNAKDFHNLMDVYLDAVFNPDIYNHVEIFQQEGWHYEMSEKDAALIINGVVYNEMRGVYSSPDSVLGYAVNRALFPDNIYSLDSGGDPDIIPSLSREEYLAYHKEYYHPSNSYIYLYGDVDAEKELEYIDSEYLSKYDNVYIDSEIKIQNPFEKPIFATEYYSVADKEEERRHTSLSYNVVTGRSSDKNLTTAMDILGYVLVDVPGAPLQKALVDAGICSDVDWSLDSSMQQPVLSIIARNSEPEKENEFISIVDKVLNGVLKNGMSSESLDAAINHFEFNHKEGNFGRAPKGLVLGLESFESWLYDDEKPQSAFMVDDIYENIIKEKCNRYFEKIIKDFIIDNTHKAYVKCVPEEGLNQKKDLALTKKLEEYKKSLSEDEKNQIIKNTKHLKQYQSEASSEENLKKIPMLSVDDIDKKAIRQKNQISMIGDAKIVHHDIFTNGISYVSIRIPILDLTLDEYKIITLLSEIFEEVDTCKHTYSELSNEIDIKTGGISFDVQAFPKDNGDFNSFFVINFRTFDDKISDGFMIAKEILSSSKFADKKRIKEIICEIKGAGEVDMVEGGHTTVIRRALSYISSSSRINEETGGIGFYDFLRDILDNYDEKYDETVNKMECVLKKVLRKKGMIISFTSKLDANYLEKPLTDFVEIFSDESIKEKPEIVKNKKNEGLIAATKVQYVAEAGNFIDYGLSYRGELNVLQVIFSYDYLWTNIRVLGGAYGRMCAFNRSGNSYFATYRDPHLKRSYDVFRKTLNYVENFKCSDRDMTKYIIGTIAKLDMPLTPVAEGNFSFGCYIAGISDNDLQRERDEILMCTADKIRELSSYVKAVIESGAVAAIGSREKIEEDKECFKVTKNLL